jgi:hypothetical protein
MTQGKQVGLSATQKSEIWSCWKAGQSLHEIGRAFGKGHSSIRFLLLQRGGKDAAVFCFSSAALSDRGSTQVNANNPASTTFRMTVVSSV